MTQTHREMEAILHIGIANGMAFSLKLKEKDVCFVGVERYNHKPGLQLVELKPFTLYGTEIAETVFHISEIEKINLLNVCFDDPVYTRLRRLKNLIRTL